MKPFKAVLAVTYHSFFFGGGGGAGFGTKKSQDPGQHAARFRDLGQCRGLERGVQESLYNKNDKISSGLPTLTLGFGVSRCYI